MSTHPHAKLLFGAVLGAAVVTLLAAAVRPGPEESTGPLLVTSSLGATSAVLFVLDPDTRTLTSYEAIPGENGGLRLLGARKIQQDLHLTKYRDLSEFSYSELRDRYEGNTPDGSEQATGKPPGRN